MKVAQSLELREMTSSLQTLKETVKKMGDASGTDPEASKAFDLDSLLSSIDTDPVPSESSYSESLLPTAFPSPPPSFGSPPPLASPSQYAFHPTIPSQSGKRIRSSSVPPMYIFFESGDQLRLSHRYFHSPAGEMPEYGDRYPSDKENEQLCYLNRRL